MNAPLNTLKDELLLGLHRPFGMAELRLAHRLAVQHWHPDRNPSPDAHARMVAANLARERVLAALQAAPDQRLDAGRHSAGPPPPPAEPPPASDLGFEDLRGRGGALWAQVQVAQGLALPEGWARAARSRKPGRAGTPFTKAPGDAAVLVAALQAFLNAQGAR